MKMLLVETCEKCPYMEWRDSNCSRHSYEKYVCILGVKGEVKELASEIKIIDSPMQVAPITCQITEEKSHWVYSADGITPWNYKIPDWCELKEM